MITSIIILAVLVAAFGFYDFTWSNVTNKSRNAEVFKNRHQDYGAFKLRVEYGRGVIWAFTGILVLFGGLLYGSKLMVNKKQWAGKQTNETEVVLKALEEPIEKPVELPKREPQQRVKKDMVKVLHPKPTDQFRKDDEAKTQKELEDAIAGKKNIKGDSTATTDEAPHVGDKDIKGKPCVICDTEETFTGATVDELPSYPDLAKYISKTLKYPYSAREAGIQGRVYVEFVVNRDGTVSDVKIKRGVHELLDDEAFRVMSKIPGKWTPGMSNGHAVRVKLVQPIVFTCGNNSK